MLEIKIKDQGRSRFRKGHPWLYRDELSEHIKSVHPGFPVKLIDEDGSFLAYGVGNSQSQIAFRTWSLDPNDRDFFSIDFVLKKLVFLWKLKWVLGFRSSFRVCYSESDGLSGLILDRYLSDDQRTQALVFLISSAAFDVIVKDWREFCERYLNSLRNEGFLLPPMSHTAVLVRRNEQFKEIENFDTKRMLEVINPSCLQLESWVSRFHFYPYSESCWIKLKTDLIGGQKTGLFLDQSLNIGLVAHLVQNFFSQKSHLRILDLFCYRGSWSSVISHQLSNLGKKIEVTLVDQSELALQQAEENVKNAGCHSVTVFHDDVFNFFKLHSNNSQFWDIVICDPPAFAKTKNAIPQALKAYRSLARSSLACVESKGGILVVCSCSSVVSEADFKEVLEGVIKEQCNIRVHQLLRGSQGLDHTVTPFFPEGNYLKMLVYAKI
ncbi:MAG: methyltransferase domain-containing protein [Bdellovibrionaceae bacterium]|nr:methyltransferase domain-containing protein [Pseudobdellovibrionaceae bacterium]MDW8190209.1 methyltransferase domain-containing protein [Pseudobdellovibrionaceae bacterium]